MDSAFLLVTQQFVILGKNDDNDDDTPTAVF